MLILDQCVTVPVAHVGKETKGGIVCDPNQDIQVHRARLLNAGEKSIGVTKSMMEIFLKNEHSKKDWRLLTIRSCLSSLRSKLLPYWYAYIKSFKGVAIRPAYNALRSMSVCLSVGRVPLIAD